MATQHLTNKRGGGTSFGQDATDKISFYGATPVAKTSVTALASTAAVFSAAKTGMWAYASSTVAKAADENLRSIHAALKDLGII